MRAFFSTLALLLLVFNSLAADVRVRGYTRKDGTYVQPHMRSAPDGNFYNNWSTKGNVNPYTGVEGTKLTPPAGYTHQSGSFSTAAHGSSESLGQATWGQSQLDKDLRIRKANDLKRLGYDVEWEKSSWSEMADIESRIRKANDLKHLGHDVDWKTKTWSEMADSESRIRKANSLRQLGYDADWRKSSWSEMADIESRIRKANSLKQLGYDVDWHKSSWSEMADSESRIRKANDLKRLGHDVDWKKLSWSEMADIERKLRANSRN